MKAKPKPRPRTRRTTKTPPPKNLRETIPQTEIPQRVARINTALGPYRQASTAAKEITHQQVQAVLPFYISDEQQGFNVKTIYPAVWTHLQSCKLCLTAYKFLQAPAPVTNAPPAAALVPPAPLFSDYSIRVLHAPRTKRETVILQFNSAFVRAALAPATPDSSLRDGRGRVAYSVELTEYLFWAGALELQGQKVSLEIWNIPSGIAVGKSHLRIKMVAARRLEQGVRLRLTWAGQQHVSEFAGSELFFEDISLPDFDIYTPGDPKGDFSLTFETTPTARRRKT
jgi:hypothetical protein